MARYAFKNKTMKQLLIFALLFVTAACTGSQPVVQNTSNANTNAARSQNQKPESVTAHTTENQPPSDPRAANGMPGQQRPAATGDPIDTTKFDNAIRDASAAAKSNINDPAAKKALADAYYERGFALTEARQYAAALGDLRRAIKLDPSHQDAKKWIDQIVSIYQMLKREPPKEGEEPSPLPMKKA